MRHHAGPLRRASSRLPRDAAARLSRLEAGNPGWRPLLAVLRQTLVWLHESEPAGEFHLVDDAGMAERRGERAPRLHGLTIQVELAPVSKRLRRLGAAAGIGTRRLTGERVLALLEAAMREDGGRLEVLSRELECPAGSLQVVGRHALIPPLQGIARGLKEVSGSNLLGEHCPTCGAWPILAEVRGLEQARRLRCGRCGCDWAGEWLRCTFCGERDHGRQGSLVPQPQDGRVGAGAGAKVQTDTCSSCQGYIKTVRTLGPLTMSDLLLCDLETVELDLAALDRGFTRPVGLGFPLEMSFTERRGRSRGFWRQ